VRKEEYIWFGCMHHVMTIWTVNKDPTSTSFLYLTCHDQMTSRNSLFDSTVPLPPPPSSSPRTSSFFDSPKSHPPSPPPAPRWTTPKASLAPSPLSLSRTSSLRRRPLPPPLILDRAVPSDPLSPLHQSPSLQPEWHPPLPASSDDIALRFSPTPTYLLGEGRYAQVYLASYKCTPVASSSRGVNTMGIAAAGDSWTLCAVKRMAPDRESQTMGLREAFFLNRLRSPHGSVYIIKMIAVKEDIDYRRGHNRSSSEAVRIKPTRQRSTTLYGKDDLVASPSLPTLAQPAHSTPSISRLVLLLEHAPLGTMDRLLRTSPTLVGCQMWQRWAKQTVEALAWVHAKGIVHADVKPGNLLASASHSTLMAVDTRSASQALRFRVLTLDPP